MENIWEKINVPIEKEEKNQGIPNFIKKQRNYELNPMHVRNYINTHPIEEINIDTLYQYFGENMYDFYKEHQLPLPHIICNTSNVCPDRKLKTLEAAFQAINPNTGNLEIENFNYFQFYCTIASNLYSNTGEAYDYDPANQLLEFYNLGLNYGMDMNYSDINGYTNIHYLMATIPVHWIEKNIKELLTKENCTLTTKSFFKKVGVTPISILEARHAAAREDYLKTDLHIFVTIEKYTKLSKFLIKHTEVYEKVKNYCYSLNNKSFSSEDKDTTTKKMQLKQKNPILF